MELLDLDGACRSRRSFQMKILDLELLNLLYADVDEAWENDTICTTALNMLCFSYGESYLPVMGTFKVNLRLPWTGIHMLVGLCLTSHHSHTSTCSAELQYIDWELMSIYFY